MPESVRTSKGLQSYLSLSTVGRTLLRDGTRIAALRFLGMFFSFLIGVQLARGLGVEGYGIYTLAMSILALLAVPIDFGLPQLIVREISTSSVKSDWGKMIGVLQWSDRVVICASFITIAVVITALWIYDESLDSPLALTLLAGLALVPIAAFCKMRCAAMMGMKKVVRGQLPDTLLRPATFSLVLLLAYLFAVPLQPQWVMILGCLAAATSLLVASLMLHRILPIAARRAQAEVYPRELLRTTLPMALTEGMRVLQAHLTVILLGLLATTDLVALFKVGTSIAIVVGLPVTILNVLVAPNIARLFEEKDFDRLQHLLRSASLGMSIFTLILTIPFLLFGEIFLSLAFGADFTAAHPVLVIFCVRAILVGLAGPSAVLLNMTGHHAYVSRSAIVSVAILIVVGPPMILLAGLTGAALAATISIFLWHVLMWRESLRALGLNPSFLPPLSRH